MQRHFLIVSVTMIATLALATIAIAADPSIGTWKLNVAKSKFAPSTEAAVKEETMVVREVGDEFEITQIGSRTDGSTISLKFTQPQKGGAVKGLTGLAEGTSITVKVIGPGNRDVTYLRNGKQYQVTHIKVSKDGKTRSHTTKGTDAKGKPYEALMVWDRQ